MSCFDLDVTQDKSVRALFEAVQELTGGSLHILVNNAGICAFKSSLDILFRHVVFAVLKAFLVGYTMTGIDTDVREVQRMFDVNVFGPMRMVRTFHPVLVNARGTIVNIGSVGGIVPYVYGCMFLSLRAITAPVVRLVHELRLTL
ncbi:MAG: hypothetical protein Q9216_002614 [Gyalolechia sp. 2 TL-2023]